MKVSVWDTYVKRGDSLVMHFDILVPYTENDENHIRKFGKTYLKDKIFKTEGLETAKCNFCHIEEATETIVKDIEHKGFSIIELENCD